MPPAPALPASPAVAVLHGNHGVVLDRGCGLVSVEDSPAKRQTANPAVSADPAVSTLSGEAVFALLSGRIAVAVVSESSSARSALAAGPTITSRSAVARVPSVSAECRVARDRRLDEFQGPDVVDASSGCLAAIGPLRAVCSVLAGLAVVAGLSVLPRLSSGSIRSLGAVGPLGSVYAVRSLQTLGFVRVDERIGDRKRVTAEDPATPGIEKSGGRVLRDFAGNDRKNAGVKNCAAGGVSMGAVAFESVTVEEFSATSPRKIEMAPPFTSAPLEIIFEMAVWLIFTTPSSTRNAAPPAVEKPPVSVSPSN